MPRYLLGAILALFFVVSLVLSAPAQLLGLLVPKDQVVLQAFDGTVWRGSASRCMVRTGAGYLHLGAVEWSLQPLSLLLFSPRLSVRSSWGSQTVVGDVVLRGEDSVDLHDFEASFSADLVRQFAPINLAGTLSAQFDTLLVRDGLPAAGGGRLVWQNAGWRSPQGLLPLGNYALDIEQAGGDELRGEVLTLSGPVKADGALTLLDRVYTVDVLVRGEGSLDPQVKQALSLVANPEQGGYRFEMEGEI